MMMAITATAPSLIQAQDAPTLRARHAALAPALARTPYGQALHVESRDRDGRLSGEVYARLDHPYAQVSSALRALPPWCEMLILHPNVKGCVVPSGERDLLRLYVGRKYDQPLSEAHRFEFRYHLAVADPDYLRLSLEAAQGPLGTRDYRIQLEVVALDPDRSFLHLSYEYAHGLAARTAMRGYLATIGRDKVGFSVTGQDADGQPLWVRGTRGVIERNTVRYFLAIDAYLGTLKVKPDARRERRLNEWYTAAERYARQLHEMERDEYLELKRHEIRRQATLD